MRQKTLLLALGLTLSPFAFAGVAELPPVTPLPGTAAMAGAPKVPSEAATAATVSAGTTKKRPYIVPSIQKGSGDASSTTGGAAMPPPTPAQVWKQAISTPPEVLISVQK